MNHDLNLGHTIPICQSDLIIQLKSLKMAVKNKY